MDEKQYLVNLKDACSQMIRIIETIENPQTDSSGVRNFGFSHAKESLLKSLNGTTSQSLIKKPDLPQSTKSCNRHSDCDAADQAVKAKGGRGASHCHDDECEDCFGC